MAKPAKTGVVVVKKKVWVPIMAPALFNNAQVGETYVESPEMAVGTKLKVSVMTLTGDPQKQNTYVALKIISARDNQLLTEVVGYSISTAVARKMVRRGRNKIEESFTVTTKDGKTARVKPALVTRNKTKGGVVADLRKKLKEFVTKRASEKTFEDLVKELVAHKFQREIIDALKKTYPIQFCEIKNFVLEKTKQEQPVVVPQEPKAAVPVEKAKPETA